MKRLSLLIAILLVATIGGVYANWIYMGNTSISRAVPVGGVGMTTVVQDSNLAIGDFYVEHNVDNFTIDQKEEGDYTAVLQTNLASGTKASFTITFTPKVGASSDIMNNGVEAYVYFAFALDVHPEYEDKVIFASDYGKATPILVGKANSSEAFKWTKDGSSFTVTIEMNKEQMLRFANEFVLDSVEKNEAFELCLPAELTVHVTTANPNA
ncbi:MAG: hypothetical protein IKJ14_05870 [Clostridia bacterium]|nr:hypothetical protein [Clostridia bacterium]